MQRRGLIRVDILAGVVGAEQSTSVRLVPRPQGCLYLVPALARPPESTITTWCLVVLGMRLESAG